MLGTQPTKSQAIVFASLLFLSLSSASARFKDPGSSDSPPPASSPAAPACALPKTNAAGPFAGVFVAVYTKKDAPEAQADKARASDALADLIRDTGPSGDPFRLMTWNWPKPINTNYYLAGPGEMRGEVRHSPNGEYCGLWKKRPAMEDTEEYKQCVVRARLDAPCQKNLHGLIERRDCNDHVTAECGPCEARQSALRGLALDKVKTKLQDEKKKISADSGMQKVFNAAGVYLVTAVYFDKTLKRNYYYVNQTFWLNADGTESTDKKILLTWPKKIVEGTCTNPVDECCWSQILQEAVGKATDQLRERRQIVESPPPDPAVSHALVVSPPQAAIVNRPSVTAPSEVPPATQPGTPTPPPVAPPTATPPPDPSNPTPPPPALSLFGQRSMPTHIALGFLSAGLATSGLSLATLVGLNWGDSGAGVINLGSDCGPRMNMSCGTIQHDLKSGVWVAAGATLLFGVGVAATVGYEYAHRKKTSGDGANTEANPSKAQPAKN